MNQKSDEELISDIKDGDIESFEFLVKRYQQRLFIFAYRILDNKEDAEEIVQDSLFSVYKHIDSVDVNRKFSSFVFSITKNTAISHIRTRRRTVPLEEIVSAEEDESIFTNLTRKDTKKVVTHAVNNIDKKYRNIVKLYYFADLSYEEISRKCNIPLNTVRTRLRRAKSLLKEKLPYDEI
jgi:RNA polymerase sigma-70 factor, ECF subfamily